MAESGHRAGRTRGQFVEQTDTPETAEYRNVEPGRQVCDRHGRGWCLGFHADHEGARLHDAQHLLIAHGDARDDWIVLQQDADARRVIQPAKCRGGHRRIFVGDLCHQRHRRARYRANQSSCLRHRGIGVPFGQPKYVRQIGFGSDGVGHLVGLVGGECRGLTKDAERDQPVASVGCE